MLQFGETLFRFHEIDNVLSSFIWNLRDGRTYLHYRYTILIMS